MSATHAPLPGSQRRLLPGSKMMGHCNSNERVELTLKLRRKAPLPALPARPATPMTRKQCAAAYGANDADIAKVKAAMIKFGLEVLGDSQASRSVHVAGPIKVLEDVFKVKLFEYSHERGDYRGRTGIIHIPMELDGIVIAVYGLDNRRMRRRIGRARPPAPRAQLTSTNPNDNGYFPELLAEAYGFPPGDGAGQVIGIFEFGGGLRRRDLEQFCNDVGVSVPTVKVVSVDDTPQNPNDLNVSGEVMLDVEVIAGACPAATQVVYFGSPQFDEKAWVDILGMAIHDDDNSPFIISISYGLNEDDAFWQDGTIEKINETFQEAAMMGITVCVSSGDDGSAAETDSGDPSVLDGLAHVEFPASSPFVLSVGGTDLRFNQGSVTEVTWKDGNGRRSFPGGTGTGGATGGGVSAKFDRPTFQSGITISSVDPGANSGRVVPDVAAHAANNGVDVGYFTVLQGSGGPVGGTSGATPLWAALIARINAILAQEKGPGKRAGYLTPVLYQNGSDGQPVGASACKDITKGNNSSAAIGGYSAGTGYDAVTGWGSPIGTKLLDALRAIV
jgi:kumamolisin